ncbi:MAG: sensor domain-containing diguanylate cyclase [Elusimicrobiota bacterium]
MSNSKSNYQAIDYRYILALPSIVLVASILLSILAPQYSSVFLLFNAIPLIYVYYVRGYVLPPVWTLLAVLSCFPIIIIKDETLMSQIYQLLMAILFLSAAWCLVNRLHRVVSKQKHVVLVGLSESQNRCARIDAEIANYEIQEKSYIEKSERYQLLSSAARELGGTLDTIKIRTQLLSYAQKCFPQQNAKYQVSTQINDMVSDWVIARRSPLLISDISRDLRFASIPDYVANSLIAAPVFIDKQIAGVLRIDLIVGKAFDSEDLRMLDILCSIASTALSNALMFNNLHELSVTDTLTGMYTQRFFIERMNEEILRAGRYHTELGLVMIDIDHFKKYNDTYGHDVGDIVLRRVAGNISNCIEETDILGRYGGEEFVVLFPRENTVGIKDIAEHIRDVIEKDKFLLKGKESFVTVSAGTAVFPGEATTGQQLVRVADERLYKAKQTGRNRVVGSL